MLKIERDIRELGGIASTAELLRRGHSGDELRLWARHPRIVRVRKGWYALSDGATDVLQAWRVGGPLACVSAAIHLGVLDRDVNASGVVHVCVPATSARLRTPLDHRRRLAEVRDVGDTRRVVVHWSRDDVFASRLTVPLEAAWAQIARCGSEEARAAIRRAANR
jgi:hypothetical protein